VARTPRAHCVVLLYSALRGGLVLRKAASDVRESPDPPTRVSVTLCLHARWAIVYAFTFKFRTLHRRVGMVSLNSDDASLLVHLSSLSLSLPLSFSLSLSLSLSLSPPPPSRS